MIASVPTSTLLGVDGYPVSVEAQVVNGMPTFALVGLPDAACREARERVRAAFSSSELPWPKTRITVNMAPSDLRKTGSAFDLAIAVAVLVATGTITPQSIHNLGFIGELGLDGSVRSVDGIVPLVASTFGPTVVVPASCVDEAAIIGDKCVLGVKSLRELVDALDEKADWVHPQIPPPHSKPLVHPDLADVRAQPLARWALEVAAAGGHNSLFVGPPGSGKTMLARRLPGLLPALDDETKLTATRVHSAAGMLSRTNPIVAYPPFRAPHHTASRIAITGGGSGTMRPGEVSLAHGGVLFLDETAEFPRSVLDTLRQPLEEGVVRISRAHASVTLPARFLLVGATNPCPCGEGLIPGKCRCGSPARERYMARLSGPLLDRFDLRIQVMRPDAERFFSSQPGESTADVRERVLAARAHALGRGVRCNAELTSKALELAAPLDANATNILKSRLKSGAMTARGLDRIRRIALTLADLDDAPRISEDHVCSALELRPDPRVSVEAA